MLLSIGTTSVGATDARSGQLDFVNPPEVNEVIGGVQTIQVVNIDGLDSVLVEVEYNGAWSEIDNLTTTPWSTNWDTTGHDDGDYRLRITGHPTDGSTNVIVTTGIFVIDNTAPSSLTFTVDDATLGDGSSTSNRAWFNIEANSVMTFRWSASDSNLEKAVITSTPGTGNPPSDGPGALLNRWSWAPGDLEEGTHDVVLTVHDEAGNIATRTLYLGIDRSGPSIGTPAFSVPTETWTDQSFVTVGGVSSGATDSGGSGIDYYEWRAGNDAWSNFGNGAITTLPLTEGQVTMSFRAVDRLGNTGSTTDHEFWTDRTDAVSGGWSVPEITSRTMTDVTVSLLATDIHSGLDAGNTTLRYGFDRDGAGSIPDITNRWLDLGTGMNATLSSGAPSGIDWSTKEGDWLALSAVMVDVAGNQVISPPTYVRVVPGIDFTLENVNVDRLIVAANTGDQINVTGTVVSNQVHTGSLLVRLEMAPSDRTSDTNWTVLETRTLEAGDLYQMRAELEPFNVQLLAAGEYDLRLVVDPDDTIPEKDEGNNEEYLMVSGARPRTIEAVSGFMPALILIVLVAGWMAWTMRPSKDEE